MIPDDSLQHPLGSLGLLERIRVSWFRTHRLSGSDHGRQIWVLEALSAMTDDPVALDLYEFEGTFEKDGIPVSTHIVTAAGMQPACQWHLTHDGRTWALSSLRPAE